MDSRYRRYAQHQHIPKYLVDCPRELVTHCLRKISIANSADLTGIVVIDHGLFSILSHKYGYKERYMTNFGDEDNMPYCTCRNWKSSAYPCEHFFFWPFSENIQLVKAMIFPNYTEMFHFLPPVHIGGKK